ncbi:hypothetical protein [Nocardioides zeae]|uniref:Uncharacterized protein n=1 Tax=Nocardioides zeae TaxID=1457234 RepID=A0AAJ1U9N1_9ACTN|nr:hypothetical protein [Nocardioides zeae]MDQ1106667.1 hypothetical protein [Nocardioides zeae]
MRRRRYAAAAALVVPFALAGCTEDGPADAPAPVVEPSWPATDAPLAESGLVWWADGELHLGDGSTVPVGGPDREPGDLVVGGDRVWVRGWVLPADLPDSGADDLGPRDALHLVDASGDVDDTDVEVASLAASPDGRYVALIDLTSGEADRYGTPQAATVVVDTRTGEEVVRSTDGMGDPATDDFAALYPDVELEVRGFADGVFWIDTAEGTRTVDPADGRVAAVDPGDEPEDAPWQETVAPAPNGVDPARWLPLQRLADGTVVAVVADASGSGGAGVLATCAAGAEQCTPVPESAGRVVRLPAGSAWDAVVDLGEPRWDAAPR